MPGYVEDEWWECPGLSGVGSTISHSDRNRAAPVRQKIGFVAPSQKPRYIVQAVTAPIATRGEENNGETTNQ